MCGGWGGVGGMGGGEIYINKSKPMPDYTLKISTKNFTGFAFQWMFGEKS